MLADMTMAVITVAVITVAVIKLAVITVAVIKLAVMTVAVMTVAVMGLNRHLVSYQAVDFVYTRIALHGCSLADYIKVIQTISHSC